jgi:rare lipoprotein A (peptidoglycan hydrolase)
MHPTRPQSRRLAVTGTLTGGLLAGLAVTAPLLAVAEPAAFPPSALSPVVVAHAAAAPSALPARSVHRASRSTRSALPVSRTVVRTVAVGRSFDGMASWYGGAFHGRRTASGERFDANGLTTASRTLPFGTRLRVCRQQRCVVVRVTDRGPFSRGRVLDLSRGARDALGFSGVAHVTATPVATRRVPLHPRSALARTPVRVGAPGPVMTPPAPLRPLASVVPARDEAASLGVLAAAVVGTSGVGLGAGRRRRPVLPAGSQSPS